MARTGKGDYTEESDLTKKKEKRGEEGGGGGRGGRLFKEQIGH